MRASHVRIVALTMLCCISAARLAEGQGVPDPPWPRPPRVAIVVLDSGVDRMSDSIADLTKAELERLTTRGELEVLSNRLVNSTLQSETPAHWSHHDIKELMKLVRTITMVDVAVLERRPVVTMRAIAHYVSNAHPDTLPLFKDRSDTAVAQSLARHLWSVTVPRAAREMAVREREVRQAALDWKRRGCKPERGPFFEYQVDEMATFIPNDSTHPRPMSPTARGTSGKPATFLAQFLLTSSGIPDVTTLKFLTVPSQAAADSARFAIWRWRFRPARVGPCPVSLLMQVELER
jgi:hypothetical protein